MQGDPPPRLLRLPPIRPLSQQEALQAQVLRPVRRPRRAVRAHPQHDGEGGVRLRRAPGPGGRAAAAARVPRGGRGHVEGRR